MQNVLVIVDPFVYMNTEFETEIGNNFCFFLNHVCEIERKKGTKIIYSLGNNQNDYIPHNGELGDTQHMTDKSINELIKIHQQDIITNSNDLWHEVCNINLNNIFFGGFWFGKCVFSHVSNLIYKSHHKVKPYITMNLCLTLPNSSWIHYLFSDNNNHYSSHVAINKSKFSYSMWGPSGFEKIKLQKSDYVPDKIQLKRGELWR